MRATVQNTASAIKAHLKLESIAKLTAAFGC
jgi:hypothetical protein